MQRKILAGLVLSYLFSLPFSPPRDSQAAGRQKEGETTIYARARKQMVQKQIAGRGVRDPRVLQAMLSVPRHRFVPAPMRPMAYNDSPLPIGEGQTISQPYIVAYMTEALQLQETDRVLEIGTGSGYQAAILAQLAARVYSVEIIAELARRASKTLQELGYDNVIVKAADGYRGWPEKAPFDAIIVTAAPKQIPRVLKEQLKIGGRMIIPVGPQSSHQELTLLIRTGKESWRSERLIPVRFVPMTGGIDKR